MANNFSTAITPFNIFVLLLVLERHFQDSNYDVAVDTFIENTHTRESIHNEDVTAFKS